MGRCALSSAGSPCDVGAMARPRLTVGEKLVYGFGDIIIALRMSSFQFYLLPFYTDVVLLAPWLAGIGKMIGLLWDGINDPLVGHLSDRTRSRLGRRRPYLLATAVPLGIAFAAVWSPPAGLGAAAAFAWLVGSFFVLDTVFTLYATPYMALGAELSTDYHERTQLAAARALFHLLGLMAGVTLPAAILARFPGAHAEGYRVVGVTLGLAMIVVALVTGSLLRERRSAPESAGEGGFRDFVDTLAGTLRNPSFRVLITTFGFILLGGGLYQTLVPYAITYWLGRPAAVGGILAVYMGASVCSLPIWTRLARRLGKDRALRLCMVWAAIALGSTPLVLGPGVGNGRLWGFLALAGLGNGGWMVLPVAITADVIDHDELLTARRREGAYFGVWTLVMKVAAALASGAAGVALQVLGYVPNQPQSAATILGIKWLYGPIPAVLILLGLVVFSRFPLTREKHREIQQALALRRAAA